MESSGTSSGRSSSCWSEAEASKPSRIASTRGPNWGPDNDDIAQSPGMRHRECQGWSRRGQGTRGVTHGYRHDSAKQILIEVDRLQFLPVFLVGKERQD